MSFIAVGVAIPKRGPRRFRSCVETSQPHPGAIGPNEEGLGRIDISLHATATDRAAALDPAAIHTFAVDVSDRNADATTVAEIESTLGPIEHALACAGIARVGPTLKVKHDDVDLMMRVNYGGVVNLIDAVLPRMLQRRRGELAVLASATGLIAPRKMAAYGATKAAVIGYLQSLRYEVDGSGVKLACVCPAAVATPMAEDFIADPAKRKRSMAISPKVIVAAMEQGLHRGTFLVIPGVMSKGSVALQRFAPGIARRLQRSEVRTAAEPRKCAARRSRLECAGSAPWFFLPAGTVDTRS